MFDIKKKHLNTFTPDYCYDRFSAAHEIPVALFSASFSMEEIELSCARRIFQNRHWERSLYCDFKFNPTKKITRNGGISLNRSIRTDAARTSYIINNSFAVPMPRGLRVHRDFIILHVTSTIKKNKKR